MSRYDPPADVVRASMFAAALPLALLGWLVATVAFWLTPLAVAVSAGGAAAWGARAGLLDSARRRGFVRRQALRGGWLLGMVGLATVVLVVSGTPPVAPRAVALGFPVALLVAAFGAGRSVGRTHRRQADPLSMDRVHRAADAALVGVVLIGIVVVFAIMTLGWTVDGLARPPAWIGFGWLLVAVAALVGARPGVLHARTSTTRLPDRYGWVRALLPMAAAAGVLITLVAIVLNTGVGAAVRSALPQPPAAQLDLSDAPDERPPATSGADEPPDSSGAWYWLLVALLFAVVMVAGLRPMARRRRPPQIRGPGMPLLEFLRSLFAGREARRVVVGEEIELEEPSSDVADVAVRIPLPAWTRRLRPRPRDPTAAVLHDYRQVQRRLPPESRRRPSETPLAHAARQDTAALRELADLVCAIRYAGHAATAHDAALSRELTRELHRT